MRFLSPHHLPTAHHTLTLRVGQPALLSFFGTDLNVINKFKMFSSVQRLSCVQLFAVP